HRSFLPLCPGLRPGADAIIAREDAPVNAARACRPPPGRAALLHSSLFTIHFYLFRSQGNDLPSCPSCAPHFFFSLQEKKKRAAPGAKEKEGLGCKQRWTRA